MATTFTSLQQTLIIFPDQNPNISDDLQNFGRQVWLQPPNIDVLSYTGTKVSITPTFPVASTGKQSFTSLPLTVYFNDFYFHLIATPQLFALGNILSSSLQQFTLWNAYPTPVTVNSIEQIGMDGITLVPPSGYGVPPFNIPALKELLFGLQINIAGPPAINASLIFHTNVGDVTINITGSRVVVFPFQPDWSNGIKETLHARSTLVQSRTGSQQGVAQRTKMRRSFSIPYTLWDNDAQTFDNLVFGWQARLFGLPCWPEQTYTTAAVSSGSSVIACDTTGRTFTVGQLVMIFNGNSNVFETKLIQGTTSSSITLSLPLGSNWPKGSIVLPVFLAAMTASLQGQRLKKDVLQATIDFDCDPATTDPNTPNVVAPTLYRTYEVYLGKTNWRDGNAFNYTSDYVMVDFQTGASAQVAQQNTSPFGRSHDWYFKNLAAVSTFRSWLWRRRGKTVGVWMPTGYDDFTLMAQYPSGSTVMRVATNGYALFGVNDPKRQDIIILLSDGTTQMRRIVSAQDQGDGTTLITPDTPITRTINIADVVRISFLNFFRMTDDDTVLQWYTPGVADATTGLITTKALA